MNCRLPILLVALAATAACQDNPESDRRTASGQVLEGTISDAMLPLDTVTSQPPLMKAEVKKTAGADADETGAAEGDTPADASAPVAPAETPPASEGE